MPYMPVYILGLYNKCIMLLKNIINKNKISSESFSRRGKIIKPSDKKGSRAHDGFPILCLITTFTDKII